MKVSKYQRIFFNSIQAILAFRLNFFFGIFAKALNFFIFIFLWVAVYQSTGNIKGFSLTELTTYFLLTALLDHLLEAKTFAEITDAVKDGKIASYLILPANSLYIFLARTLGRLFITIGYLIIPIILIIVLLPNFFVLPASLLYFSLSLLMTIIAVFISLFLYTILGSVSFWTVEVGNIIWGINFMIMILSGKLIPTQFMSDSIRDILVYSPFSALFNLPASIYLGKFDLNQTYLLLSVQTFWALSLFFALNLIWKKGLQRLELVGN